MVTKLEGTPQEVATKVSNLLSDPSVGRQSHAIALVVIENGSTELPPSTSDDEFRKLMAEAAADTVSVGHMDDSREAMYTRMPGE